MSEVKKSDNPSLAENQKSVDQGGEETTSQNPMLADFEEFDLDDIEVIESKVFA
jgi:hypothetical protein